uniref:Glycosyltransferase family 92 protein n=1 Tax=Meloidogyne floridensis TaxID=298350 RepID=A0A915NTF7_9BILA
MNNDEKKRNMNEEEEKKKEMKGEEEKKNDEVKEEVKGEKINDEVKKRVMIGGIGMIIQMKKEEMREDKGKINNEVELKEENEGDINSDEILTESALKERIDNEKNNQDHNTSNNFCDGENVIIKLIIVKLIMNYGIITLFPLMAYNVSYGGDSNTPRYFLNGKKFDCSLLSHLKRFNLTDRWNSGIDEGVNKGDKMRISYPHNMTGTPFVLAANFKFYPSLRAIIDGIRRYFIRNIQIIVYDLGGLSDDKFIEMFREFNSFIYCDTSIQFHTNDYKIFIRDINRKILGDFQFTLGTHHGLKFATHPDMFSYIPLDPSLTVGSKIGEDTNDIEMMEANMLIVRKSDFTRQLLKWSVLCALTPECIEPLGASISCQNYDTDQLYQDGRCHRQDQSVMNILLHNLELK